MKTIISVLIWLTGFTLSAQTTIKVPVSMTVEIPVQTNSVTIITNVTNVYVSTNSNSTPIIQLQDDVIDWKLGTRLIRFIQKPTTFTTSNFGPNAQCTLYWVNPGGFPITFPSGSFFLGPAPTNQIRGAVLLENVSNELWITP